MTRVDSAILAFLGVLLAHEVAYLTSSVVGYETSVAHGHLKTAWLLGSLFLLGLLSRSIITSLRRRHHDPGNVIHLAGSIAGGYFLMEQFERAIDGYGALTLFNEPVFWLGMAAAPLVAIVLSRSLHAVQRAVSRFVEAGEITEHAPALAACSLGQTSIAFATSSTLSSVVSRRGPPLS